jgi:hypothetical protein
MNQPTLQRTAVDIVKKALRLLGVIDAELSLNAVDREQGIETLNDMVKSWQQQGFHLWTMTEGVLFLQQGVERYELGDNCKNAIRDNYKLDSVTVDYVPASLLIEVADSSIYTMSEAILITLDSGLKFETTVAGFGIGSILIADEPTDTISSGNDIFLNIEYINRPMSVIDARFRESNTREDIPTYQWARTDYFEQPDKTSQGTVTCWYYSPQLTCGDLYVWQSPSSNNQQLRITYVRPTEITPENGDNPDFPSEWFMTLAYNLALYLADEYTVTDSKFQRIQMQAMQLLESAKGFDNEDTYTQLNPDHTR